MWGEKSTTIFGTHEMFFFNHNIVIDLCMENVMFLPPTFLYNIIHEVLILNIEPIYLL